MPWPPGPPVHQKQPEEWEVGAGAAAFPKLTLEPSSAFSMALGGGLSTCALWGAALPAGRGGKSQADLWAHIGGSGQAGPWASQ